MLSNSFEEELSNAFKKKLSIADRSFLEPTFSELRLRNCPHLTYVDMERDFFAVNKYYDIILFFCSRESDFLDATDEDHLFVEPFIADHLSSVFGFFHMEIQEMMKIKTEKEFNVNVDKVFIENPVILFSTSQIDKDHFKDYFRKMDE